MHTIADSGQLDTTTAVIDAARTLTDQWQITPHWRDRLTPDARQLVDAVIAHDRTRAAVTCVTCGAEWPNHHPECPQIRPVRAALHQPEGAS